MKKILLTLTGLFLVSVAFAQWGDEEMSEQPTWRERVFTGGGFGLSFSSYYDYVSVSPLIGYRLTPKLAAGVQIQYRYTRYKMFTPKITAHDYGASPFVRYSIYGPLFLHAEYEYLSYEQPLENRRKGFSSFLAGGGFFQPLGRRAGFYALALYNFSYVDPRPGEVSPYDSPWVIRAGVTAGF